MTRRQFEAKAVKTEQRRLGIPAGWWGRWTDVTNGYMRVYFRGGCWRVAGCGIAVTKHNLRAIAIKRAVKLYSVKDWNLP
jgi:hypothetical protein